MRSYHKLCATLFLLWVFSLRALGQAPGGIGAMLILDTAKDGTTLPRIKQLLPNSPAAAQNLPEGAYIISVNDVGCKNKKLEDVVNTIRGEAGTSVTLQLADNPQGKKAQGYTITRVAIQQAPAPDPVAAFNESGDMEAKKLKKQGFAIVKTFTSDCGDFFFNFDTDNSLYHVKVLVLETKTGGTYSKGFEAQANMFDNSNETLKTPLKDAGSQDMGNGVVAMLEGAMAMKRNSIGVVSIQIHPLADAKKCTAMYVVVYK